MLLSLRGGLANNYKSGDHILEFRGVKTPKFRNVGGKTFAELNVNTFGEPNVKTFAKPNGKTFAEPNGKTFAEPNIFKFGEVWFDERYGSVLKNRTSSMFGRSLVFFCPDINTQ